MDAIKEPITVAQLMERLSQFDPTTLVMIECADDYYSGPLALDDLEMGEVSKIGPYDWTAPSQFEGRPGIKNRYPGGWWFNHDPSDQGGEVLDRQPCLAIRAD